MRTLSASAVVSLLALGALRAAADEPPRSSRPTPPAHESAMTRGRDCAECHTTAGWSMGDGTSSPGEGGFDHSATGFPLRGRHRAAPCLGCHAPDRAITRACVGCHADDHEGQLGQACERCHESRSFRTVRARAIHAETRLPLTGMHAVAECSACHRRHDERRYTGTPADCFACHAEEYRRPATHPAHTGTATSPAFPHDCSQCHRTDTWSFATIESGRFGLAARRGALGALRASLSNAAPPSHEVRFPLRTGPHRGAPCTSCHLDPQIAEATACTGCHAHGPTQLRADHRTVGVPADGRGCLGCHPGGSPR